MTTKISHESPGISDILRLALIAFLIFPALAEPAGADDWKFNISGYVDRASAEGDADQPGLTLQSHTGISLEAERSKSLPEGRVLTYGATVSSDVYPGDNSLTRYRVDLNGLYVIPVSVWKNGQIRFSSELSQGWTSERLAFVRGRIALAIRSTVADRQTLQFRVRVGYRDQEEIVLSGYDQFETLFDLMHLWSSKDGNSKTTFMVYADARNAAADKFSYEEYGARMTYRHVLTRDQEAYLALAAYSRKYDGVGRVDEFVRVKIGYEQLIGDRIRLDTWVGFQVNNSNFLDEGYGGGIAGFRVSRSF